MIIKRGIDSVGIVIRSRDAADVRHVGNTGKLFQPPPIFAAVFSHLDQTIVRAYVDQTIFLWRLSQRRSVAKERRRSVLRHRVHAPDLSHHRELVAIQPARKLSADYGPAIAAIVAAEKFVGREINARVQVWTDDERRIPVPAQRIFAATGCRLNREPLTSALIKAR